MGGLRSPVALDASCSARGATAWARYQNCPYFGNLPLLEGNGSKLTKTQWEHALHECSSSWEASRTMLYVQDACILLPLSIQHHVWACNHSSIAFACNRHALDRIVQYGNASMLRYMHWACIPWKYMLDFSLAEMAAHSGNSINQYRSWFCIDWCYELHMSSQMEVDEMRKELELEEGI